MLQPNDCHWRVWPIDLSDEAAAKLLQLLHELTAALERHYYGQLQRYYNTADEQQREPLPALPDPPF